MKVAIIGSTGYGGVELIRILQQHPAVSLYTNHSSSQDGSLLTEGYPHLQSIIDQPLQAIDTKKIASEADLVFTATPSGISAKLVPELLKEGLKVIDLSGDYRLKNSKDYEQWYNKEAGDEHWLHEAVYGLTEWLETDLKDAKLVANPGCYPTAALLGLAPLIKDRLIDEKTIIIDAKTGVTGAGKNPSPMTHFSEMNDNLKIYKVNKHQHIPEIEQVLTSWDAAVGAITFSTHLLPMTRGIMTTMYANATEEVNIDQLHNLYKESYKDDYFVRIREKGIFPSTKEVYGSNFCDISIAYDERTNRIMIVSVIDNLMKGASGQAVQNMNKMLGMEETMGLEFVPVFP
ncbi:N-acetyl-gamma-glutamyl-phosphate reductase [Virgibacillus alimentarius]|uniref:N-acetyl-gamma-glutamyl-phosphate reductase n=1 Tax=Virgibacillus alimentarius TaxID=698769 RepID=A0ABS4S5J2_9BACI|nr:MULTISPECIES: N-acetyl-gamma-glutamyl-phosphate reductase [Virgibacillus]MBP2256751.1 N-acetyl-gamma-glutamyl-phosphate reductase [Virgibacillus alimentarius]HLR65620.1 N-acetyl-gamma-glutamyl-phosphate reductase [Virgibacillus sp.]